jgi:hypothetical protein
MADFSYFDQFQDQTVDLTEYLKNLSVSGYNYRFGSMQPVVTTLKNLFIHYEVVLEFKKNLDAIIHYIIPEDYSIDKISYDLYGTTDYWWIIYVFNNIKNPWLEWPFCQEQLTTLTDLLYNEEGKYSRPTYYKFLHEENEIKKNIIVLKEYALRDFIWSYRQQILNL